MQKPEKISNKTDLLNATRDLIKFNYWYINDIVTVAAHLFTIFILPIPAFTASLIERVSYQPFSLIPE